MVYYMMMMMMILSLLALKYNDISDHLPIFCIYKLNKFNNSIIKK